MTQQLVCTAVEAYTYTRTHARTLAHTHPMQDTTSMEAANMFPDKVEELQRLEEQIKGGTTAGWSHAQDE